MVSIRTKLAGLVAVSLLTGVGSVVAMSISIFLGDKSSYLMEWDLAQVKGVADSIDHQVDRAYQFAHLIQNEFQRSNIHVAQELIEKAQKSIHFDKLLIFDISKTGELKPVLTYHDDQHLLERTFAALGWNAPRFLSEPILIAKSDLNQFIQLGIFFRSPAGGGKGFVFLLDPTSSVDAGLDLRNFYPYLVNSVGEIFSLAPKTVAVPVIQTSQAIEMLSPFFHSQDRSGIRRWNADESEKETYLLAYHRLKAGEFIVIGLVSDRVAFSAVWELLLRTIWVGLGILLISVGLMLFFMKNFMEAIGGMMAITEKVREGIFHYRLETAGLGEDEVGNLATSFNLMASKIDEVIGETAHKIEQKFNQEIVQSIQNHCFPAKAFEHPHVNFSGKTLFAQQHGGDWWHYEKFGDALLVLVAKAEGKPHQAAQALAAVRSSLNTYKAVLKMNPTESPTLKLLVGYLNEALFFNSAGMAPLNCFAAWVDLPSGTAKVLSFGDCYSYLCRNKKFEVMRIKKNPPLGKSNTLKFKEEDVQLQPGDMILTYTPGFLKAFNAKRELISADEMLKWASESLDRNQGKSEAISSQVIEKISEFLGAGVKGGPVDVTIGITTIPSGAKFESKEPAVA